MLAQLNPQASLSLLDQHNGQCYSQFKQRVLALSEQYRDRLIQTCQLYFEETNKEMMQVDWLNRPLLSLQQLALRLHREAFHQDIQTYHQTQHQGTLAQRMLLELT